MLKSFGLELPMALMTSLPCAQAVPLRSPDLTFSLHGSGTLLPFCMTRWRHLQLCNKNCVADQVRPTASGAFCVRRQQNHSLRLSLPCSYLMLQPSSCFQTGIYKYFPANTSPQAAVAGLSAEFSEGRRDARRTLAGVSGGQGIQYGTSLRACLQLWGGRSGERDTGRGARRRGAWLT